MIDFASKNFEDCKVSYETCQSRCEVIKQEFRKFLNIRSERSKIYKHWHGALKLISLLKEIMSVREVNGKAYFHAIQKRFLIFFISGSIKCLRYVSWCLEKMRKLPEDYPQIHKYFQERNFQWIQRLNISNQLLPINQKTSGIKRVFDIQ